MPQPHEKHSGSATTPRVALVALVALAAAASACSSDEPNAARYQATIRWTEGGIPHVAGKTFGDAGFGVGYAFAKLNACLLVDQVLRVNSQRAATFGPGKDDANVDSDFFQLFLGVRKTAEASWPLLGQDARDTIEGYAAGFNHRLAEVGVDGLPTPCKGAAWVRPITALDMLTYFTDLSLVASSRALPALGPVVIHAQPPAAAPPPPPAGGDADEDDGDDDGDCAASSPAAAAAWAREYAAGFRFAALGDALDTASAVVRGDLFALPGRHAIGSNGIALGKDKSTNGKGMVLGNPHFPWAGELRFWQLHVTVPGKYDVAGAGLMGSPIPNIGFNKDVAWTHTVSKSMKFTAYRLKLVPGKPTSYLYEGKERAMTAHLHIVAVKQPDGSMQHVERTYYRSHYGPVVAISGLAEWTTQTAFTIRDANASNHQLIEHFQRVGQAGSVAELEAVMATVQANPWVNTIAADRAGNAFYAESNSVPNLSDASYAAHAKAVADGDGLAGILAGYGIYVLDGSVARDEWAEEAGSRVPGLVPWAKTPHATRSDYLANANESYWLSHVAEPLPPAAPIFGDRNAPRTLRTRVVLHEAVDVGPGSAAGDDGKFTVDELASIPSRARVLSADLMRQGALDLCQDVTSVTVGGNAVALGPACTALAAWDGRDRADSKGAHLWRETVAAFVSSLSEHLLWDDVFAVPFDKAAPLTTPHSAKWKPGSNGKPSKLAVALATAVQRLDKGGFALDAALGSLQFVPRGDGKVGVPGGMGPLGSFSIAGYAPGRDSTLLPTIARGKLVNGTTDLTVDGYVVNYGSSFMMAVTFDDKGPVGKQILTYSQSEDPASPHHSDQTQLYRDGKWLDIVFHDKDIAAAKGVTTETVAAKR